MNPIFRKELSFSFKGSRTYVQGPDIIDQTIDQIKNIYGCFPDEIIVTFHRLLKRKGLLCLYNAEPVVNKEDVYANFEFSAANKKGSAVLFSSTLPISGSLNYNEKLLLQGSVIDKYRINMQSKNEFSCTEQIVALTKRLHKKIYPDAKGKWIFTKIHLYWHADPFELKLRFLQIQAEKNMFYRLTQNSIWLDGNKLGEIWFSLAPGE